MNYLEDEFITEIHRLKTYFNMIGYCKEYQARNSWPIEAYNIMGSYARELYLSLGDRRNGK
jgi:hypothetical protein